MPTLNAFETQYHNTTAQLIIKLLVCVFLFPLGLLILLWRGQRAVSTPIQVPLLAEPGWYEVRPGFEGHWNGTSWDPGTARRNDYVAYKGE